MIKFSVNGDCKPAPRPRLGKFGAYVPKDYQAYKETIQQAAIQAMAGDKPILDNVEMTIQFRRKYKNNSRRFGDVDNLIKGVMDACNKTVFADDSQVVKITASKIQSPIAGIDVSIALANEQESNCAE